MKMIVDDGVKKKMVEEEKKETTEDLEKNKKRQLREAKSRIKTWLKLLKLRKRQKGSKRRNS